MRGQRIAPGPREPGPREPFGIYLHFPFCRSRCGYCDFDSVVAATIPQQAYTDAVLAELEARAPAYRGLALQSVYFGGGTPSLWRGGLLERVLARIRAGFASPAHPGVEVTLEVNPGDALDLERLQRAGVNRLSVGVQSLDDGYLRLLGRRHDARAARSTVQQARAAGFENIGCDLIFGLPGQSTRHHLEQLARLLELGPDHVSAYSLTLSRRAPLRAAGHTPAPQDEVAEMMERGRELLTAAGLPQYEVSNYAREGRCSVHNTQVWAGRPYLGLGASAHSMQYAGPVTWRVANPPLEGYLAGRDVLAEVERLTPPRACFEHLFLGLRTVAGVDRAAYRRRFEHDPLERFGRALAALGALGLVEVSSERIAPTPRGIWFSDELALRLLDG